MRFHMNIVCATLNSKYIHSALSSWCIRAGIESFCEEKHNVYVVECTINSDLSTFVSEIIDKKPDVIAFSCYIWNIQKIIEATQILKNSIDALIVLGGPEAENNYVEILDKHSTIDYIICGEGEWSFSDFINAYSKNNDLTECNGLCLRQNGTVVHRPAKAIMETPPSPYVDDYFKQLNNRIVYIESSRGCPFRCSYCLSGTIGKMRCFSLDQIKNDLVKLSNTGTKTIKFVDRTFNANTEHCNALLSFILNEYGKNISKNVCFHFEFSGDIIKESTLELLKLMPKGLCQIEIGIQSFNKSTLDSINRSCDLIKLKKNILTLLSFNNIHIHTDLIAGLPFESLDSFKNTFNEAYNLKSHMLQLGFLKLLHGADFNAYTEQYKYNFTETPPYEVISNRWLSHEDLTIIYNCEIALDKLYNSGRFLFSLDYIIRTCVNSPFEILSEFGKTLKADNISLAEISERLFDYFGEFTDKARLRENILCDLASIDANIHIPEKLKIYSKEYKLLKKKYTELFKENIRIVECKSINKIYVVRSSAEKDLRNRRSGIYFDV